MLAIQGRDLIKNFTYTIIGNNNPNTQKKKTTTIITTITTTTTTTGSTGLYGYHILNCNT